MLLKELSVKLFQLMISKKYKKLFELSIKFLMLFVFFY